MSYFVCTSCGEAIALPKTESYCGASGYAVDKNDAPHCYPCACKLERAAFLANGHGVAYVGNTLGDGMGVDRHGATSRRALTTWAGEQIGTCFLGKSWPVHSYVGSRMHQIYATIGGREFTGRGFGTGMAVVLRETAASKRKR